MARYTEKEKKIIEVAYDVFVQSVSKVMDAEQMGYIDKAYRLALEKYDGRKTLSGGLYILTLIEMADIAANEVGLRSKTVVGIFLHNITQETDVSIEYIKEHFGDRIALIVDGYDKITNIQISKVSFQSEQFRRLYLSLIDDIRVVLIKIIHRLYDMRHREDVEPKAFKNYLKEVKYLSIPIVHRLGLYEIKKELEEKVMIYEFPEDFEDIKNKIRVSSTEQEHLMENFLAPIRKALEEEHIEHYIKWRTKSIPSIYEKMKTNNLPFEQIFDIFAVSSTAMTTHAQFFLKTYVFISFLSGICRGVGFPGGASGKEPTCQCWRCRFNPWVGRSPGEGHGNPLQYSCLENPMDRGAQWAIVHRVTESDITEAT